MRISIPISFGLLGALGGILLGIPSFTANSGTRSKPPLFDVYCDFYSYSREACEVSAIGVFGVAAIGAAIFGVVGLLIALAFKSSGNNKSGTSTSATGNSGTDETSSAFSTINQLEEKFIHTTRDISNNFNSAVSNLRDEVLENKQRLNTIENFFIDAFGGFFENFTPADPSLSEPPSGKPTDTSISLVAVPPVEPEFWSTSMSTDLRWGTRGNDSLFAVIGALGKHITNTYRDLYRNFDDVISSLRGEVAENKRKLDIIEGFLKITMPAAAISFEFTSFEPADPSTVASASSTRGSAVRSPNIESGAGNTNLSARYASINARAVGRLDDKISNATRDLDNKSNIAIGQLSDEVVQNGQRLEVLEGLFKIGMPVDQVSFDLPLVKPADSPTSTAALSAEGPTSGSGQIKTGTDDMILDADAANRLDDKISNSTRDLRNSFNNAISKLRAEVNEYKQRLEAIENASKADRGAEAGHGPAADED